MTQPTWKMLLIGGSGYLGRLVIFDLLAHGALPNGPSRV